MIYATKGNCSDSGHLIGGEQLTFPTSDTYRLAALFHSNNLCDGTFQHLTTIYPTQVGHSAIPDISALPSDLFTFPLPSPTEEAKIQGYRRFTTIGNTVVTSVPEPLAWGSLPIEWEIEWELWPEEVDAQLVLDAVGYEDWLPKGPLDIPPSSVSPQGALLTPGSTLTLKAEIFPSLPSNPASAKRITFTLASSNVPGVAMNAPLMNANQSPLDLQFEASRNTTLLFEGPDRVTTPDGNHTEAYATLSSFDYGAYGEARAVAVLTNGKALLSVARFPYPSSQFQDGPLLLPKRSPNSFISDAWKFDPAWANKADSDDSEKLPDGLGDGHAGDGLTLYEEYRGFFLNGQHVRTLPTEVDYFLRNEIGTFAEPGINLFQNLTKLKVHKLAHTEINTDTRVINQNSLLQGGRHHAESNQHAVILKEDPLRTDVSETIGGPSTPANIASIQMAGNLFGDERKLAIAHELGHSVNIPHHGEGGLLIARWEKRGSDYWEVPLYPSAAPEQQVPTFFLEDVAGSGYIPGPDIPKLHVSVQCQESASNVFSGDENCIMRYRANALIRTNFTGTRFHIQPGETLGSSLCNSAQGSSFNSPGGVLYSGGLHRPSRHGDAASNRGDCQHRICVNDRYRHAPRYGQTSLPVCTMRR
ncbi:hypothetical protein [Myxococcus sp. AB056]|uniref:hypothetical protein n=1 Tax=Myxococcus sp. AB056 TaxID=2562792 RepID=UPI001147179A|nr:hypothetical protein [Myxococcus sp. AB056]